MASFFCLVVFLSVLNMIYGRTVPITPCGKLFNYWESETKEIFGAMKFKNDLGGEYHLEVNMSIPTDTDKNIRIHRRTSDHGIKNGEDIEYYVLFPFNHTFPLLTKVVFNNKVYCTGPPSEKTKDHGVTELSARNDLSIEINQGVLDLNKLPTFATQPSSITIVNIIPSSIYETNDCGVAQEYQALIFKGGATKSDQYPWLVAMFHLDSKGTYQFRCAGNLITKRHVLTAAHCLRFYKVDIVTPETVLLVLGKHNIKAWASRSTLRDAKSFHVHPDYEKPGDADIAIIYMSQSVEYTPFIKPICLWNETNSLDNIVSRNGVVVGWGKDESGAEYINEPKQVSLPIVSQESCLRSDDRFIKLTSNRTFCAGLRDGSGPCTGDSGGGFVMKRNGKWTIRGIVSAALVDEQTHTCDVNNYIVFSDVPKYTDWILEEIDKSKKS